LAIAIFWVGAASAVLVSLGFPNVIGNTLSTAAGIKVTETDIQHLFIALGLFNLVLALKNPTKLKLK